VKAGGLAGAVANHVVMHIGGVNAVIGQNLVDIAGVPVFGDAGGEIPV
jgi:hypothetical protein